MGWFVKLSSFQCSKCLDVGFEMICLVVKNLKIVKVFLLME